jgi:hypothetical protein
MVAPNSNGNDVVCIGVKVWKHDACQIPASNMERSRLRIVNAVDTGTLHHCGRDFETREHLPVGGCQ